MNTKDSDNLHNIVAYLKAVLRNIKTADRNDIEGDLRQLVDWIDPMLPACEVCDCKPCQCPDVIRD